MVEPSVVVTGAAGFIGTQLCETLSGLSGPRSDKGRRLIALDKLLPASIPHAFQFRKADLSRDALSLECFQNCELLYHLAANPEVRVGASDTAVDYENNILATRNILEALKNSNFHGTFVFASTSTVYGEASRIPTPESYAPMLPISMYGASKLACESLISAYASLFHFKAKILRFANVVGGSSHHGVVFDFVAKLRSNPRKLEILGDGTQAKSYVHINDCISGLLQVPALGKEVDVFNLGTEQTTTVLKIAEIVSKELGLRNVTFETGHGTGKDGRGWPGDVKNMMLDCKKLLALGWKYKLTSDEAIRLQVREMIGKDH